MKVDRKVDTVIIEMQIDQAEKLTEILANVEDNTRMAQWNTDWDLSSLFNLLTAEHLVQVSKGKVVSLPHVRFPSPLTKVILRDDRIIVEDAL